MAAKVKLSRILNFGHRKCKYPDLDQNNIFLPHHFIIIFMFIFLSALFFYLIGCFLINKKDGMVYILARKYGFDLKDVIMPEENLHVVSFQGLKTFKKIAICMQYNLMPTRLQTEYTRIQGSCKLV